MLKFFSTDSDDNKSLSTSFPEIKDIDEFLNKKSAKEIQEFLNNKFEDLNKKEKSSTNFANKILPMMFYEHFTKNNFSFGDSTKEIIDKIVEISILVNEKNSFHIENFVKLYFIMSSNIKGRYFLISKFLNFLNEESKNEKYLSAIEFNFDIVENMFSDFLLNEKVYERKEIILFYEEFAMFIYKNKLFECLKR